MARSPYDGMSPEQIIDDLGVAIADRYRQVEFAIRDKLSELGRKAYDAAPSLVERRRVVRELKNYAENLVSELSPEAISSTVAQIVAGEASADIARQLVKVTGLDPNLSTVSAAGLWGVAASELDLRDNLRALNERIYRAPADAYQRMTAAFQADRLIGQKTWEQVQRTQVERYIVDGITGFVDKGGRRWSIGNYSEMATRTASARAWRDQSVVSMQASGIDTFGIAIGADACTGCGQWAGKTLTEGGKPGRTKVPHAITGELTEFTIDATVADARAAGWGHPNCRCVLVPSLPGYQRDATTFDPELSAARVQQRKLETEIRHGKRDGDADAVKRAQAELRELTDRHGIRRRSFRESLAFDDGQAAKIAAQTKAKGEKQAAKRAARKTELDKLPRLDRRETLSEATYSANPGAYGERGKRQPSYTNNCHQVVNAMELRARGYDVRARETFRTHGRAAEETALDWVDPKTGKHRLPWNANPRARSMPKVIAEGTASWEDGARGFMSAQHGDGGHIFNIEKVNGVIEIREGQVPVAAEGYLTGYKAGSVKIQRIDDLVPHERILASVTPADGKLPEVTVDSQRAQAEARIANMREIIESLGNGSTEYDATLSAYSATAYANAIITHLTKAIKQYERELGKL